MGFLFGRKMGKNRLSFAFDTKRATKNFFLHAKRAINRGVFYSFFVCPLEW